MKSNTTTTVAQRNVGSAQDELPGEPGIVVTVWRDLVKGFVPGAQGFVPTGQEKRKVTDRRGSTCDDAIIYCDSVLHQLSSLSRVCTLSSWSFVFWLRPYFDHDIVCRREGCSERGFLLVGVRVLRTVFDDNNLNAADCGNAGRCRWFVNDALLLLSGTSLLVTRSAQIIILGDNTRRIDLIIEARKHVIKSRTCSSKLPLSHLERTCISIGA